MILSSYYKLYTNKFDKREMDKSLYSYTLLSLDCEGKRNLNRPITNNKTDSIIKKFPIKKWPGPESFTDEFYQIFKEKLILILLKLLPEIEVKEIFTNTFYKTSITHITKTNRTQLKKNYSPDQNPWWTQMMQKSQQNTIKPNPAGDYSLWSGRISTSNTKIVLHAKSNKHDTSQKDKGWKWNNNINRCRRDPGNIQHHFMIKILNQLGTEATYLHTNSPCAVAQQVILHLMRKSSKHFKVWNKIKMFTSMFFFSTQCQKL